jgi:hypothetical protein
LLQIVIPQAMQKQLDIQPEQKMHIILYDNRIVLIPDRPIQEALGSLQGIDTDVPREEEDRV